MRSRTRNSSVTSRCFCGESVESKGMTSVRALSFQSSVPSRRAFGTILHPKTKSCPWDPDSHVFVIPVMGMGRFQKSWSTSQKLLIRRELQRGEPRKSLRISARFRGEFGTQKSGRVRPLFCVLTFRIAILGGITGRFGGFSEWGVWKIYRKDAKTAKVLAERAKRKI